MRKFFFFVMLLDLIEYTLQFLIKANLRIITFVLSLAQGPFEKFVDSPYYSESELCGGAVTVSFSKYLPR
jgi:hypothetical protein